MIFFFISTPLFLSILLSKKLTFSHNRLFPFLILFIFLFVLTFRGDFTIDYNNVISIFNYQQSKSLDFAILYRIDSEFLYLILNKIIFFFFQKGFFSNIFISAFTMLFIFFGFKKYSKYYLFLFTLFIFLPFYSYAFNISRQIFAISLVIYFFKDLFMYKISLKTIFYFLIIIYIHFGAIILLPFIFIGRIKLNFYYFIFFIVTASLFYCVITMNFNYFKDFLIYFNPDYRFSDSYGTGPNFITNVIIYPLTLIFTILISFINFSSLKKVNLTYLFITFVSILFFFLSLNFQLLERFGYYLFTFFFFFVGDEKYLTLFISKKYLINTFLILLYIYFNYTILNSAYFDYYFIWENFKYITQL